jgi:molecular chaperone GrpE
MEERDDIEIEMTQAEDDHIEDTEFEEEEATSKDKLKQLRDKLKRSEQEKMAAMEDLQRAKADFLNARKRLDEEKSTDRERAKLQFVEDILPLCDSFSLALNDPAFQGLEDNLKKGILGINLQLSSVLKGYGATEFGQTGDKFDPNLHEALADEGGGSVVKDVLQKGYKLNDRIIRHAKVTVE